MTTQSSVLAAAETARKFLARKHTLVRSTPWGNPAALPDTVGGCSGVFWWDDRTALFEFPFLASGDARPRGYVVVSSSRDLPPVLESAWEGPPLSAQLNSYLIAGLAHRGVVARSVTWLYLGSLDPVAHLEVEGVAGQVYLTIPEFEPLVAPKRLAIHREPRAIWPAADVEGQWDALENWADRPVRAIGKLLLDRAPKRYQQNCDAYSAADGTAVFDSGTTYCSPHCIAGCGPVAWTMLASCYKRINQNGSNSRIWPNSTCWNIEWPSTTNPSQCREVSDTIWAIHKLVGTTCGGFSYDANLLKATEVFSRWGLHWHWGQRANVGYDLCAQKINAGQPFLFSARGPWNAFLQAQYPDLVAHLPSGGPGKEGHVVVCYGYEDGAIRICLGWGNGFYDKDIAVTDYADNCVIFVTQFGLSTAEAAPAPKHLEPAVATPRAEAAPASKHLEPAVATP